MKVFIYVFVEAAQIIILNDLLFFDISKLRTASLNCLAASAYFDFQI